MKKNKNEQPNKFERYLIYLIVFSFLGWIWEVTYHFIKWGNFVNRGMFHGPWIPIYGFGSLIIIILLKKYKKNILKLFITSSFFCSILEYFTGWFIEVTRHARWWDYSNRPFNINGRICLFSIVGFGIGGLLVHKIALPVINKIIEKMNKKLLKVLLIIVATIFTFDIAYSIYSPNSGKGVSKPLKYITTVLNY